MCVCVCLCVCVFVCVCVVGGLASNYIQPKTTCFTCFNNNLNFIYFNNIYNQHCIATGSTDAITVISSGFKYVDKQLLYIVSVFSETP